MTDTISSTAGGRSGRPPPGTARRPTVLAWLVAHERALFLVPASLCLALLAAGTIVDPVVEHLDWRDLWPHAAVLREWAAGDLWMPKNPHYLSDAPSREYTPWFLLLTLVMRATGLSQFGALRLAAGLGLLLLYGGLYAFCTVYFRSRLAAALGLAAGFFLFGQLWEFVGFVNFRSQLYNAAYPSYPALGMALLLWALVVAELREPSRWRMPAIGLLFAVLLIDHQLTGGFALGGGALLILFEPGVPVVRRLTLGAALVAGGALAALWPIYDPWQVVGDAANSDPEWAPPPHLDRLDLVLLYMAPQLLGLAGLLHPRLARRMLPLTVGFAGLFAVFLFGNLTHNSLAHRLVPFACLFLTMGVVALWLGLLPGRPGAVPILEGAWARRIGILAGTLALLGVAAETAVVARDIGRDWMGSRDPIRAMFEAVTAQIPPDSVSIATPGVALTLTSYGRKVVVIPRGLFLVPDEAERRADTRRFFAPGTDDATRRAILARWHVRQIVFRTGRFDGAWWHDELPDATVAALHRLGPSQTLPHRFEIVRVEPPPP